MVVDDEPLVCESVRRILAVDGHQVETATSGEAALALFGKVRFDLMIVNYELPLMSGDKVAAAIKALYCFGKHAGDVKTPRAPERGAGTPIRPG